MASSPPSSKISTSSSGDPQLIVEDKIRYAFENIDDAYVGIIQFWAPIKTGDKHLLTTNGQPFKLAKLGITKDDRTIISNGAPARAFRNQLPELLADPRYQTNPLESLALKYELRNSILLPVFDPSQSGCVGVVECVTSSPRDLIELFNILNDELEKEGLITFDARKRLACRTISSLQHAKEEIDEALPFIVMLPFAQVWIAYEDENQAHFSSSLQDTGTKRMLWLKLTSHSHAILEDGYLLRLKDYSTACYRIPLKMEKDFAEMMTHESYEPRLIQNISKFSDNKLQSLLSTFVDFSCFVVYLRSTKTGDLVYVFEFLWEEPRDKVILLESLLLALKKHSPSFKFACGKELDDEIDILDLQNSTRSEKKYFKIFQTNKLSLEKGRSSRVREDLVTIRASYAGDVANFTLPVSSATFKVIENEIGKKFELDPAHYKLKYFDDEDNEWYLFTSGANVRFCTNNNRDILLRLFPRDPSHTRIEK
ncbi:hypothetical protein OSB04_010343 [Centaurea solstitialis]|uniref:NLP1-9 GAF domain-containing protein n=1 Tax=Centaurea solstitialis TaxID=347529 RepID=A0AA38T923_9ASTR|nr:hypothetical protein OSB04_010343 [Centaurea solstitialis]